MKTYLGPWEEVGRGVNYVDYGRRCIFTGYLHLKVFDYSKIWGYYNCSEGLQHKTLQGAFDSSDKRFAKIIDVVFVPENKIEIFKLLK